MRTRFAKCGHAAAAFCQDGRLPSVSQTQSVRVGKQEVEVVRSQVPIVPVYGRTIDSVQGLTIPGLVVLDLFRKSWSHGQVYVAVSNGAPRCLACVFGAVTL
jgi:hypothetical protein